MIVVKFQIISVEYEIIEKFQFGCTFVHDFCCSAIGYNFFLNNPYFANETFGLNLCKPLGFLFYLASFVRHHALD